MATGAMRVEFAVGEEGGIRTRSTDDAENEIPTAVKSSRRLLGRLDSEHTDLHPLGLTLDVYSISDDFICVLHAHGARFVYGLNPSIPRSLLSVPCISNHAP